MTARARVAIFGGGRVGCAMAAEMPDAPVVHRGEDAACDVACICWPAHAIRGFAAAHPRGAAANVTVAFCNGCWAREDGADHAGICYVRAVHRGDRARLGQKGWRVGHAGAATILRSEGLGVTLSSGAHEAFLWEKALYLLPLALTVDDLSRDGELTGGARMVVDTDTYAEWYDMVRRAAVRAIGEIATAAREARVHHLVSRTPRGWLPSPSPEELAYFRERLSCAA